MDRPMPSSPIPSPVTADEVAAGGPPLRGGYPADFTLDLLARPGEETAAAEGVRGEGYTAPFSQYFQAVLDPAGGLVRFGPDLVFLALSLRLLRPESLARLSALSEEERRALVEEILAHVEEWVAAALPL